LLLKEIRVLFAGKFISISSAILTIILTLLVWKCVNTIEEIISGGWIGKYRTGFPFVYSSGGAAATPIPDHITGQLIYKDGSGYYSNLKYWANWMVYLLTGLSLNAFSRFGIFSDRKSVSLFFRYFLAFWIMLALLPLLFGNIGLTGNGLPFPFIRQHEFREYSNSVDFIPAMLALDFAFYLVIATGVSFTHFKLIRNRKQ
jgi:hypothetical protein